MFSWMEHLKRQNIGVELLTEVQILSRKTRLFIALQCEPIKLQSHQLTLFTCARFIVCSPDPRSNVLNRKSHSSLRKGSNPAW